MKSLIILIAVVFSFGCATSMRNTSPAYESDKFDCEMMCTNYASSFTSPSFSMGSAAGSGIAMGLIAGDCINKCMRVRGW